MQPLYEIEFEDNTFFKGGTSLNNSLWTHLPEKHIKKLTYNLNYPPLVLQDYEKYNHIVEHAQLIQTNQQGIIAVYLMARKNGITHIWKYTSQGRESYQTPKDKEFRMKKVEGWKPGLG